MSSRTDGGTVSGSKGGAVLGTVDSAAVSELKKIAVYYPKAASS